MDGSRAEDIPYPLGQDQSGRSSQRRLQKRSSIHLLLLTGFRCSMRIMAGHALCARVVPVRIQTFDFRSLTGGISEESVAPEAKLPGSV